MASRLALLLASAWLLAAATPLPDLFGGPFSLTDHLGRRVTEASFPGRFTLVYFGYTHCPDLCPTNLSAISEALDALAPEDAARVQPLFVTVDPGRDDLAALREYVGHFHPGLLGLRGTPEETRRVLGAYRVHRRKILPPDAAPEDYLVDHGTLAYLVGPDGVFRTLFPHDTAPERMAAILRDHLAGRVSRDGG